MDDHHSAPHTRSTRVLDPSYLEGVEERPVGELRVLHAECLELETEVSYVRRITQARIDIAEAELERRRSGRSLEDLIGDLPQILADSGPRATPASSRLPLQMEPAEESEWAPELAETEGLLANLAVSSESELATTLERLRSLERWVSDERRSLHAVMDRIDLALAERLRAEVSS